MIRQNIDDINDDMVLGEAVSLPTGKMLLNAGIRITQQYKKRLKELGYRTLLINEAGTEQVVPRNIVSDKTVSDLTQITNEAEKKINNILSHFREDTSSDIHKLIFDSRKDLNKYIMNSTMANQMQKLLEEIFDEHEIVLNLAALQKTQDSIFSRAINVAITSLCIGKKYHFGLDEMKQLGIGALNYHLGLLALPKKLFEKKEAITEEDKKIYRQHTIYGYLMLSQNPHIPSTSAVVALHHHELQNGTGYPLSLKGRNLPPLKDISQMHVIHRFAEIVSVAEMYHMMIPETALQDAPAIQESIKRLIKLSGTYLNSDIIKTLISIIPAYPVGTRVRIIDAPAPQLKKYIGVVSQDNPSDLSKPKILLYQTTDKKKINPPLLIDTAKVSGIKFEVFL